MTSHVNNSWIARPPNADTVFVFVHGVLSSSSACWKNSNSVFWPEIVASEIDFNYPAVYISGYHTRIDSGRYDIRQCATEVFDGLKHEDNNQRSVIAYANIVFVCHSLGGIVVRRLLEENYERFRDKAVGLVLLASPTLGSAYATLLSPIALIYQHKLAKLLRKNSEALDDIDDRFRNLLYERRIPALRGAEAVEENGPLSIPYLPSLMPPVVVGKSASRYFGPTQIIASTNHFTICKPDSGEHSSHKFLKKFYKEQFLPVRRETTSSNHAKDSLSKSSSASLTNKILFDVYSADCAPYYVDRSVDETIRRSADMFSIWLFGPSGSGKTSLLKRYIESSETKPFEITLSHAGGDEVDQKYWVREISESFAVRHDSNQSAPISYNDLIETIAAYCAQSTIPIFMDEVPISVHDQNHNVARFIGNLLDSVKRRVGGHIRFVVCSINPPQSQQLSEKFKEQFQIIELTRWTEAEIKQLISVIAGSSVDLSISEDLKNMLASKVNGSPRSVKRFFKQVYLNSNAIDFSAEYALDQILKDGQIHA